MNYNYRLAAKLFGSSRLKIKETNKIQRVIAMMMMMMAIMLAMMIMMMVFLMLSPWLL